MSYFNPLNEVIRYHSGDVHMGGGDDQPEESQRAGLVADLELARQRSGTRFGIFLTVLVIGFLLVLVSATFSNGDPKLLTALTGGAGGGFGAILLQFSRSWWRADTLLTVAKHVPPAEMSLIFSTLLQAELPPLAQRRSSPRPVGAGRGSGAQRVKSNHVAGRRPPAKGNDGDDTEA